MEPIVAWEQGWLPCSLLLVFSCENPFSQRLFWAEDSYTFSQELSFCIKDNFSTKRKEVISIGLDHHMVCHNNFCWPHSSIFFYLLSLNWRTLPRQPSAPWPPRHSPTPRPPRQPPPVQTRHAKPCKPCELIIFQLIGHLLQVLLIHKGRRLVQSEVIAVLHLGNVSCEKRKFLQKQRKCWQKSKEKIFTSTFSSTARLTSREFTWKWNCRFTLMVMDILTWTQWKGVLLLTLGSRSRMATTYWVAKMTPGWSEMPLLIKFKMAFLPSSDVNSIKLSNIFCSLAE